ncbi:MAG: dihydroorotate dehydrogenase electron transfer subunit [Planctomycetota bacterium]
MVKSTINAEIIANKPLQTIKPTGKSKYFRMSLSLKAPIKHIIPGQFINLRLVSSYKLLLRRPFTIFNAIKKNGQYRIIEIIYQVVGKGTRLMSSMKRGEQINVLGPLGNGFTINKKADVSFLVAGGIGIAGLYLLFKELVSRKRARVYLFIGAKTKSDLCLLPDLRRLTNNIIVSTEDGSSGAKGFITTELENFLNNYILHTTYSILTIYSCGPLGMSEAIRKFSVSKNIPAQISLEERMGCGIGLCRVCVCRTISKKPSDAVPKLRSGEGQSDSKGWGYSTVCKDGPVFDASQLFPIQNH